MAHPPATSGVISGATTIAPIMIAAELIKRPSVAIDVDKHIIIRKSESQPALSSRELYKTVRSLESSLGINAANFLKLITEVILLSPFINKKSLSVYSVEL
jgi:hypothetical protein